MALRQRVGERLSPIGLMPEYTALQSMPSGRALWTAVGEGEARGPPEAHR